MAEGIGKNLIVFDNEKEKMRRLEMGEKLQKKIMSNKMMISGPLLD